MSVGMWFETVIVVCPDGAAASVRDDDAWSIEDIDALEATLFAVDPMDETASLVRRRHPRADAILARAARAPAAVKRAYRRRSVLSTGMAVVTALDNAVAAADTRLLDGQLATVISTAEVPQFAKRWRALVLRGGGIAKLARVVDAVVSEDGKLAELARELDAAIAEAVAQRAGIVLYVTLAVVPFEP
jgi:hypothetical protein